MNDFLTEKNKKAGVLGKLKWVLCGFCILLSLGAIGASEKYIGEGRCVNVIGDMAGCVVLKEKIKLED